MLAPEAILGFSQNPFILDPNDTKIGTTQVETIADFTPRRIVLIAPQGARPNNLERVTIIRLRTQTRGPKGLVWRTLLENIPGRDYGPTSEPGDFNGPGVIPKGALVELTLHSGAPLRVVVLANLFGWVS